MQRSFPEAADLEKLRAVEHRMVSVASLARGNATRIHKIDDDCKKLLQAATRHLVSATKNYKRGYTVFADKLAEADTEYQVDRETEESVQDLLVGAAVSLIGPEVLVGKGLLWFLRTMAMSTSTTLARVGRGALAAGSSDLGRVAVAGGGAAVGEAAEQPLSALMSDSDGAETAAGTNGAPPGEKFEEALEHVATIVAALPLLGGVGTTQSDVAAEASRLALQAVKLRAGDTTGWTVAELETKASTVAGLWKLGDKLVETAELQKQHIATLKEHAKSVRDEYPRRIENRLWTEWLSAAGKKELDMLETEVLQAYLGKTGKGFLTAEVSPVVAARRRWLDFHGVDFGECNTPEGIESLYKRELKRRDLKRRLIGCTAQVVYPLGVEVNGHKYFTTSIDDYSPRLAEGSKVVVTDVEVRYDLWCQPPPRTHRWRDDHFQVVIEPK